jgi:murein DD-endopeptidase MepM/ murein hydrolase activator NlpD
MAASTSNPKAETPKEKPATNAGTPPNKGGDNSLPNDKPEPKEETKENAKKMGLKGIGKSILDYAVNNIKEKAMMNDTGFYNPLKMIMGGEKETEEKNANATPKEILGQIYKAMVKIDNYRKIQYEESRNHLQEQNVDKNKKNKEIIKGLMGLVPKKTKEKPNKKEENDKESPASPAASTGGQPNIGGTPTFNTGRTQTANPPTNTAGTPPTNTNTQPKSSLNLPPILPRIEQGTKTESESNPVVRQEPVKQETPKQQSAEPIKQSPPFTPSKIQPIISSAIGYRMKDGKLEYHKGVDVPRPVGSKLYSVDDGKVKDIGQDSSRGKYIRIKLNNGYETKYFHLSDNASFVKIGDKVKAGDTVGLSGNTGDSHGPHLHIEVYDTNGQLVKNISKEVLSAAINPKETATATKENKQIPATTSTQTETTPSASKVPDLIPNKIVMLKIGDPGWFPFMSKLQKGYDGHWYRENGNYSVKPEIERFAEEKLKTMTTQMTTNNQGTVIDKTSTENKNNKETMETKQNKEVIDSKQTVIINKNNTKTRYVNKTDDDNPYSKKLQGQ